MLQVTAQEFICRKRHGLPLPGVRVLVAEGDLAVLQREYPLTDAEGKPLYKKDGKQATENRLGVVAIPA